MIIKVLGTGCPKCKMLESNVRTALQETGTSAEVVKVDKLHEIMEYDVMMTPALVIDDQVQSAGRVATVDEIKKMIAAE